MDSLAGCAESREIIFRQWLQIASGLLVFALGMHLTIYANIGLAPWDCLGMGIGKRLSQVPIGYVQIGMWAIVLLLGWLLGGPVGIGTLISTVGAGAVMQVVYDFIHFEPRHVKHRGVAEIAKVLMKVS